MWSGPRLATYTNLPFLATVISDGKLSPVKPAGVVDFLNYQIFCILSPLSPSPSPKKRKHDLDTVSITFKVPVL